MARRQGIEWVELPLARCHWMPGRVNKMGGEETGMISNGLKGGGEGDLRIDDVGLFRSHLDHEVVKGVPQEILVDDG